MADVMRLCEYSGNSLSNKEIADWLRAWADLVENRPPIRNLIMIGEGEDGKIQIISTGLPIDRARKIGLIAMALVEGSEAGVFRD